MKILGTGSALPDHIVTNDDLSKIVETSDEWITSRTGIRQRRISGGETVSELASKAALAALEQAKVSAEELDLIMVATITPDGIMPNMACMVQDRIGAVNATCFDINAACSGFLFALNTANAYLTSGMYQKILLIGAETLSKLVNWEDRTTCVLFGDGAGAAVVAADEQRYVAVSGSDGAKGQVLTAAQLPLRNFTTEQGDIVTPEQFYMYMNGQEVFKFAVRTVPDSILKIVEKAQVTVDEIDWFLLHQANERIIASVAKRLDIPMEKMPMNMDRYGNTSAASIPLLLDEVLRKGMIKPGNKVILSGFGGGLTWGTVYMEF